jgi:hypothetical protein
VIVDSFQAWTTNEDAHAPRRYLRTVKVVPASAPRRVAVECLLARFLSAEGGSLMSGRRLGGVQAELTQESGMSFTDCQQVFGNFVLRNRRSCQRSSLDGSQIPQRERRRQRIVAEVIFSLRVGALTKFTNLQNNRAVEQDDSLEILVEPSTRMIDVF